MTGWSCLRKADRPAGPLRYDDGTAGDQADVGGSPVGAGPKVEAFTAFKSDVVDDCSCCKVISWRKW